MTKAIQVWGWVMTFSLLLASTLHAGGEEVRVGVAPVQTLLFNPERDAPAEVVALQRSQVSGQVGAVVQEIVVEVGSRVSKDQVLARQDCWDRQSEASRAAAEMDVLKAEIGLARRQKERAAVLRKQGQSPAETLERRETELLTLQARLQSLEIQWKTARLWLDKCVIRSPFAGVVIGRQAQVGEWAAAGSPLFEILNDQAVEVQARLDPTVEEKTLLQAKPEFVYNSGVNEVKLRVLLPLADRTTRTREGRFEFTSSLSLPGVAGRLRWLDDRPHLPAWLLVRRQEKLGIFILQEGQARFYPLLHAQEGRPVAWSGDINQDRVILDGREGLQDGQRVISQQESQKAVTEKK